MKVCILTDSLIVKVCPICVHFCQSVTRLGCAGQVNDGGREREDELRISPNLLESTGAERARGEIGSSWGLLRMYKVAGGKKHDAFYARLGFTWLRSAAKSRLTTPDYPGMRRA